MDVNIMFKELGIKTGKKVLNQNVTIGYKITEESLLELVEFFEKLAVPKNTQELKKIVHKIEVSHALLTAIGGASYLDQSTGFMNTSKHKLLKELSTKADLKFSDLMQEIKANIQNYEVKGMPRFVQDMKYFEEYSVKNPNTRKTLINMAEALEKSQEVYHHIENDVDYGTFQNKKMTKFDLMPLLQNKNPEIRRDAFRHFKEKKIVAKESLYLLLSSMAKTRNEISMIQGYKNAHDSKCKNEYFFDEKIIYDLYKLLKKKVPLKNRLHEIRRKLMKLEKMGAQDFYAPIFDDKLITLKDADKILEENLIAPLTKEWPKYRDVYNNLLMDITDKNNEKRRSGAWCEGLNNGKENTAIIYFGKYNNNLRDVRTIAHEMNHGVHAFLQVLNGYEINNTGTPGYFYEAMAMQAENRMLSNMINNEKDENFKKELLLSKLEDSFSSIYSQIIAHFIELGFFDNTINSYEEFEQTQKKLIKDFTNPKVESHEDIEDVLIFRPHHFDHALYCIKYVFAELMAAKLELLPFNKVAALAEELTLQVGKEEVEVCFKKHGINITNLDWIKEVFDTYEERIKLLEKMI